MQNLPDGLKEIEEELIEKVKEHESILRTPICAFVTFTEQEAKERICKWRFKQNENQTINELYDENNRMKSLGVPLDFEEAPEPSDVIWENLEINEETKMQNTGYVCLTISFFLLLTFFIFTGLKVVSGNAVLQYPPNQDCLSVDHMFAGESGEIDQARYFSFASKDKIETRD